MLKFSNFDKYKEYCTNLKNLNVKYQSIGTVKSLDIHEIVINPKKSKSVVFLSTIHGDEVSGTDAIIDFISHFDFNQEYKYVFYPLANPHGFINQTRENHKNKDINRSFCVNQDTDESKILKKALSKHEIKCFHSLHEDNSKKEFYFYCKNEYLSKTIAAVAKKWFSLLKQKTVYGDIVKKGQIKQPNLDNPKHYKSIEEWVDSPLTVCTEIPRGKMSNKIQCNFDLMCAIVRFMDYN